MSTTYGREDGCFFIDYNKNLMNVAVSRAEDSFLIFGDVNCLKDEEQSPSGLLKKHIRIKNNGGIRGCSLNPAIINLVIINLAIINLAIINLVIINFATINSTITNSKIKSIHHIF